MKNIKVVINKTFKKLCTKGGGQAVDADAPEHLVLGLDRVAGIEEAVPGEELVADLLGVGVQRGALAKIPELGVGVGGRRHADGGGSRRRV